MLKRLLLGWIVAFVNLFKPRSERIPRNRQDRFARDYLINLRNMEAGNNPDPEPNDAEENPGPLHRIRDFMRWRRLPRVEGDELQIRRGVLGHRANRGMGNMMRAIFHRRERRGRRRSAYHRVSYVTRALSEQKLRQSCRFCKVRISNDEFLSHTEYCASAHGVNETQRDIPYHNFLSSEYTLFQELYKLRNELEMSFLEAWFDRTKLVDMDCHNCRSQAAHMEGNCLNDSMRTTFLKKGSVIVDKVLAHLEQWLELVKQEGLEEIAARHGAHFDSIEEYLVSGPADLETENIRQSVWYDFRKNTLEEQTRERVMFANEQMEKNLKKYTMVSANYINRLSDSADFMVSYLTMTKARPDLDAILLYRKTLHSEGVGAADALDFSTLPNGLIDEQDRLFFERAMISRNADHNQVEVAILNPRAALDLNEAERDQMREHLRNAARDDNGIVDHFPRNIDDLGRIGRRAARPALPRNRRQN